MIQTLLKMSCLYEKKLLLRHKEITQNGLIISSLYFSGL